MGTMEFWGIEVKSGEPVNVKPGAGYVLHLSQACLGESKKGKGNEFASLRVNIGEQNLVLGTLSSEKFPQIPFDLVFDKEFVLSHNWKNGSVFFTGYKSLLDEDSIDSDSEPGEFFTQGGPVKAASKQKVTIVEPNKEVKSSNDEDSSDSEELDSDEDEDDDESSSDEDEETPKKAEPSNKRPAESSAAKTPVTDKKAKSETPQKTADGKKVSGHVATPYPSKQAGKAPAQKDKSKQQTPKSGGSFSCKTCNKSFNSENALGSHSKDKHGAK